MVVTVYMSTGFPGVANKFEHRVTNKIFEIKFEWVLNVSAMWLNHISSVKLKVLADVDESDFVMLSFNSS